MAKANKRFSAGHKTHSLSNEYKIPLKDRRKFMGHNIDKWVDKKKYEKYLEWRKKYE